ncbi:GH24016 [Drosophila grimshawi]|uniref:GH24016 n=1 Tax=Drosophila grimshawi TaxID=7222 RepID=B4JTK7_DROGR|nr:GH24016 [Drosophila grimshawi]
MAKKHGMGGLRTEVPGWAQSLWQWQCQSLHRYQVLLFLLLLLLLFLFLLLLLILLLPLPLPLATATFSACLFVANCDLPTALLCVLQDQFLRVSCGRHVAHTKTKTESLSKSNSLAKPKCAVHCCGQAANEHFPSPQTMSSLLSTCDVTAQETLKETQRPSTLEQQQQQQQQQQQNERVMCQKQR